ncbi:MAG: hypothetical protein IPH07_03450 [Deltaproteobacteria bacterium]|nr:hypothetical protein [Deltaproteobacteria bacterium]MBP7290958.1 hypothetical protein [Nannocystaceae bacterium]
MDPRTFQAREMREALALVRRELGPDAVILDTRRVPGRALGLLGGSFVEVTAAPATDTAPTPTAGVPSPSRSEPDLRAVRALLPERRAERARTTPPPSARAMIQDDPAAALAAAAGRSAVVPFAALRRRLLAAMVPRDLVESWLRTLPPGSDGADARAGAELELRSLLHRRLGAPLGLGDDRSRVVAFVGPTGVGKTTTVAKLAAMAHLVGGKRIALVSLDDGRIGGTAALKAYAKLLDVPMSIASGGGLAQTLAEHRDAELVLVDTPGISPTHTEAFDELGRRLGRGGEPVLTHLCVAAATRSEELERIAHLYRPSSPAALLVTKADEAIAIGSVLGLRFAADLPLSFVTTGPQVPDDLTLAHPEVLIDLLLGGARA